MGLSIIDIIFLSIFFKVNKTDHTFLYWFERACYFICSGIVARAEAQRHLSCCHCQILHSPTTPFQVKEIFSISNFILNIKSLICIPVGVFTSDLSDSLQLRDLKQKSILICVRWVGHQIIHWANITYLCFRLALPTSSTCSSTQAWSLL